METVCLQQDSDHMCSGQATTYTTTKHSYSGVVKQSTGEWNGALLSSVMRVDSVCMQVMDAVAALEGSSKLAIPPKIL